MTLDEEFTKYQGQGVLVPGEPEDERGQCVQWVDFVLHDVYGLPYHYGNAIDWWNNPGELLTNFDKVTDGSVKKGDFVVFNTQVGSVYGHIDVAMQDGTTANFQGADSNWGGNLTVHLVQHSNQSYVLGSLRKKGTPVDDLGKLADLRLAAINQIRTAVGLAPRTDTNGVDDILARVTIVNGDYDNLWKDSLNRTPTAADYAILKQGPKAALYYYETQVKANAPATVNKTVVQNYISQHLT